MDYIDNFDTLGELIDTLQLKISTVDAGDAASDCTANYFTSRKYTAVHCLVLITYKFAIIAQE
jgi:hypothetical protein